MHSNPKEERSTLESMLLSKSLKFGDFLLASGEKSDVYIDCKPTTCSARAMPLIGRIFLRKMQTLKWLPDAVGGLMVGAEPIAFAVARESLSMGGPVIDAFIVRKEPKAHGRKKMVEGIEPAEGRRVVIIDDVCTKGGSTALAIENAESMGMKVIGAICLVDREQGAAELLKARCGCQLESIFKLSDLRSKHNEHLRSIEPVGATT